MRQRSAKAAERERRLAETKRVVLSRCSGRCEGCGDREAALDLAHVVGRGHLLRAELADTPEMTTALCRDCHQKVDRHLDPELRQRVLYAANVRLAAARWAGEDWMEAVLALSTLLGHAERNAG